MAYNLFFFPSGSETATAVVRAETDDDSKLRALYEEADLILAEHGEVASDIRKFTDAFGSASEFDHSECGRVVSEYDGIAGKERKERYIFCNEEDTIASILYGYIMLDLLDNPDDDKYDSKENAENKKTESPRYERSSSAGIVIKGLTVTVDYKGDKYTNIEKVSMIDGKLGFCGIRFAAQKNGGEQDTYYLFTKTSWSSTPKYEGLTMVQSPSTGIVGENSKYRYAGNRLNFLSSGRQAAVTGHPGEDGNLIWAPDIRAGFFEEKPEENHDCVNVAHLFFERNGEDFAFSVLKNGKLYRKISKTAETVIFHYTSFDFAEPEAAREEKPDIIFGKTNEMYVNEEYFDGRNKFVNSSIIVPPIPDGDKLRATDYFAFYDKCIMALHKAFENS